jgi:hypothetical protein
MRRKRHEKNACNIAPVISGYNQLQYASGWKRSAMAKLIMWNPMTLDGFVEGPNGERVKLKLLDTRALSTGIVILRYAPAT